jgi:hypothetical protein
VLGTVPVERFEVDDQRALDLCLVTCHRDPLGKLNIVFKHLDLHVAQEFQASAPFSLIERRKSPIISFFGRQYLGSIEITHMEDLSCLSKTIEINGLNIFYREGGDPSRPKLVLLHGFPASSHQYRNLIPALADHFHIVAPDYPGFGSSDMPIPTSFA